MAWFYNGPEEDPLDDHVFMSTFKGEELAQKWALLDKWYEWHEQESK